MIGPVGKHNHSKLPKILFSDKKYGYRNNRRFRNATPSLITVLIKGLLVLDEILTCFLCGPSKETPFLNYAINQDQVV